MVLAPNPKLSWIRAAYSVRVTTYLQANFILYQTLWCPRGGSKATWVRRIRVWSRYTDSMAMPRKNSRIVEGSCHSCRIGRVKCSLTKPTCLRCERAGQTCDYGPPARFKWVGGVALRGPKAPQNVARQARSTSLVSTCMDYPKTPALDPESMTLYFINAVLPRFQLVEEGSTAQIALLLQHEPLKRAIVAVSRAHIDVSSCGTSNNAVVLRRNARVTAIQCLRTQLQHVGPRYTQAKRLLTVNVLLCMLDGMLEPSEEQPNASLWHLKGGYALLQQQPNLVTELIGEDGLSSHLLSIFATMDLVHALLSGNKPYIDPMTWHMFAGAHAWWGRLQEGDRFLDLMKLFSELAALGNLVATTLPSDTGQKLAERCLAPFESRLQDERDERATNEASLDLQSDQMNHWHTFCHLFVMAGRIFMLRALRLRAVDDPAVQDLVREGIDLLSERVLPGMMQHCTILPILILGAHALLEADRDAILDALSPTISYLSFGNLAVMKDLLQSIWRKPEIQRTWWEMFADVSERVFLF